MRNHTPGAISVTVVSVGTNQPAEYPPSAMTIRTARIPTHGRLGRFRIPFLHEKSADDGNGNHIPDPPRIDGIAGNVNGVKDLWLNTHSGTPLAPLLARPVF